MGADAFSFHYSDDNKKNTFNNGGDNGHGLKMLCANRPLQSPPSSIRPSLLTHDPFLENQEHRENCVISNKKAFQSNASCATCRQYGLYSEVQDKQVLT